VIATIEMKMLVANAFQMRHLLKGYFHQVQKPDGQVKTIAFVLARFLKFVCEFYKNVLTVLCS